SRSHEKRRAGQRQGTQAVTGGAPNVRFCARWGASGCAPRSTNGEPEPRFSGLRSSVFDANAPSRVGLHELSGPRLWALGFIKERTVAIERTCPPAFSDY